MLVLISSLISLGIKKTLERCKQLYWGITEADVTWVLARCNICQLNTKQTVATAPQVQPIKVKGCLHRVQIDLMDFRVSGNVRLHDQQNKNTLS